MEFELEKTGENFRKGKGDGDQKSIEVLGFEYKFLLTPALRASVVILETPKEENDDPVNDLANLQRLREAFLKIK